MDPADRDAAAARAAERVYAEVQSVPATIDVLLRAAGILLAAVSPDSGGLVRNVESASEQLDRFAQAAMLAKLAPGRKDGEEG